MSTPVPGGLELSLWTAKTMADGRQPLVTEIHLSVLDLLD
jgi:hypothetical protein